MIKKIFTLLLFVATISAASANQENVQNVEEKPLLSATTKNQKYSISVTGNLNLRASYDFNGAITNYPDFAPSFIPVPGDYSNSDFFYMDATTSRVELRGVAKSSKVGDIELCLNMDLRGGDMGSYMPRVRLAYITAGGFLVGRNITTFFDLDAAAPNIDFQGPNALPFIFTTQVRYTHGWFDNSFNVGAAIEHHTYKSKQYQSMTLSSDYEALNHFAPTIPAYVEYRWKSALGSHVRVTGLYKNNHVYDIVNKKDLNFNGWGAQLSGTLGLGSRVKLLYSGTCGEGITDFLQDIYGSGLDVTMSCDVDSKPQMNFMYGWQAAGSVHISEKALFSCGYSMVDVCGGSLRFEADDYRKGEFLFANLFYSLTPRISLSGEYLWGKRKNVDNQFGTSNRVSTMVMFSF